MQQYQRAYSLQEQALFTMQNYEDNNYVMID